jgi:two-component system NtrC family sensor kinase
MTLDLSTPLTGTPVATKRRILIVDDEGTIRHALRRFFQRQGWEVDEAPDGAAALTLLLADEPATYDVIISDLRMPGVSGIEMHERLRGARPELLRRIIFSTGDAVSLDAAEFVRRADCPVLQKPFELSTLRAMVERLLDE